MENAAKALLIASGVLFAIIIVALLSRLLINMNTMAQAEDERIAADQLAAFNAEYEAFRKTRMYGTELISVTNKAIQHNKSFGAAPGSENFINVEIVMNSRVEIEIPRTNPRQYDTTRFLSAGDTNRLRQPAEGQRMREFFERPSQSSGVNQYIYPDTLRTGIFQCTEFEYSNVTGRVNHMRFVQVTF